MEIAIVQYRSSDTAPLLQHIAKHEDRSIALANAIKAVPGDQIVNIVIGDTAARVYEAARGIELAERMFSGLEEAIAALPDAWAAVKCDVPRELIHKLTRLQRAARAAGLDPTRYVKPKAVNYTIQGSCGNFEACSITGRVLTPLEEMPEEYKQYVAMDVEEFRAWCDRVGLPQTTNLDVCEVRFFCSDTQNWEEAEDDFREECVRSYFGAADEDRQARQEHERQEQVVHEGQEAA